MTICKKFKLLVRERLKDHKSLYDIGMELCDGVDDPRGKALRIVKDILEKDKMDVEKYLRDNADWLGYKLPMNPNGINVDFTKGLNQKNLVPPLNSVSQPELRYKWKPIVAAVLPKKSVEPVPEFVPTNRVGKVQKTETQKEKERIMKEEKSKEALISEVVNLYSKTLRVFDNPNISKMDLDGTKRFNEYIEKIRDKCNSFLLNPDDIKVVSEK